MTLQEIGMLRKCCRQAKKHGMFLEFKDSYRQYRGEGDAVYTACWAALYDWDLMEIGSEDGQGIRLAIRKMEANHDQE